MDAPAEKPEAWSDRMRLAFRRRDQPAIALLLALSLLGMTFFFVHRQWVDNGVIDIDRSERQFVTFSVNINRDPWPAIAELPGIGEKLAQQIVQHRDKHGDFQSHDDLMRIAGIGLAKFKRIQPLLAPIAPPE